MASPPPPDHYKTLGVAKDANLVEIRSAHRKLVLKCHPDKIHDVSLKAIKQDEFQKVQEAYEVLSDENRRKAYDDLVQKYELRKQMFNGNPNARNSPFEYEIKTSKSQSGGSYRSTVKIFTFQNGTTQIFEEVKITNSKKTSNSGPERGQSSKEDVKRDSQNKKGKEEHAQRKSKEKDVKHDKKKVKDRREKEKEKDKERKRSSDEKRSKKMNAHVEEVLSNEHRSPQRSSEKKSSKVRDEAANSQEGLASRPTADMEAARSPPKDELLDEKWSVHRDYAGGYLQASRKTASAPEVPVAPSPNVRRVETHMESPSNHYKSRQSKTPEAHRSDDESARRSARRRERKNPSDLPPLIGKKSKSKKAPVISHLRVSREPPSTPNLGRKSSLHGNSSAPLSSREKANRTSAQENFRYSDPKSSLPRSQTYSDARNRYRKSEIDPDSHNYWTANYTVENGHATNTTTATHRPIYSRSPNVAEYSSPSPSFPLTYYSPEPRFTMHSTPQSQSQPQMSPRDPGNYRVSLENVNYSPCYGREKVIFSTPPVPAPDYYSSPDYRQAEYYPSRGGREDKIHAL